MDHRESRFKMRIAEDGRSTRSALEYRWELANGWAPERGRWHPTIDEANAAWQAYKAATR